MTGDEYMDVLVQRREEYYAKLARAEAREREPA